MAKTDPIYTGYGKVVTKKKKKKKVTMPKITAPVTVSPVPKITGDVSSPQTGAQTVQTSKAQTPSRPTYRPVDEASIWAQAQARTSQITDPILRAIAQRQLEAEGRAKADNAAQLAGTQKAYQDAVAPTQATYDKAVQSATTLNESVANRLAGQGQVDAQALAEKLNQINAPGAQAQSAALGSAYSAASAVGSAKDSSEVQALLSRGAGDVAWLNKQPGLAAQQFATELNTMLRDISDQYGEQRQEIEMNIPAQIQQMYDQIYGRESDEAQGAYARDLGDWEAGVEQGRYAEETAREQGRYEKETKTDEQRYADSRKDRKADLARAAQERRDALKQQAFENYRAKKQDALSARALALEYGDKKAQRAAEKRAQALDRQWQSQQKAIDRQFQAEQANIDRELEAQAAAASAAADIEYPDLTGPSGDKYITVQGRLVPNPNYIPPEKKKPAAKDNRMTLKDANSAVQNAIYTKVRIPGTSSTKNVLKQDYQHFRDNPMSEPPEVRKKAAQAYYSAARQFIADVNSALVQAGIQPNSKQGIALRKSWANRVGLKVGKMGNPVGFNA